MKSMHDRFGLTRRILLTTAATLSILSASALSVLKQARAQTDPLPSWHDGTSKRAITEFVARVTRQGGPDFYRRTRASPRSITTAPCGSSIRCTFNWPSRSIA